MLLKLSHIADPPDVVSDPVRLLVAPSQFASTYFLAKGNRFEHRTVAVPAAADVVHFSAARRANELCKRFDQVEAVDVITNLFALVSEDAVRPAAHRTDHQVRQETVQLRPGRVPAR